MRKLLLFVLCSILLCSACRYRNGRSHHVSGGGSVNHETRTVGNFTGVESDGNIDVVLIQGDYHVEVEADHNLVQHILTDVRDGKLVVHVREGISFGDYHEAHVIVTAPNWKSIVANGSADFSCRGKLVATDSLELGSFGSGDLNLELDAPSIRAHTDGSGDMELRGETRDFSVQITGSGDVKAASLKAEHVKTVTNGSGDTEVYASDSLNTEIYGSGDVHYRGEPKMNLSIHGSGEVGRL